jgi:hypothetical protein
MDQLRGILQTALAQRLGQHLESLRQGPDVGDVPVASGLLEALLRPSGAALGTLGLAREGLGNISKAGTGFTEVANAKLNPFMALFPDAPGSQMARQALAGYDAGPENPVAALLAANEAGAAGHGFAQSLVNLAHDPTSYLPGGGGSAAAREAQQAGRIAGGLGIDLAGVNAILSGPEMLAGHFAGRAASPALRAIGNRMADQLGVPGADEGLGLMARLRQAQAPTDPAERAAWQARYAGQSQAGTDILARGDEVAGTGATQADLNQMGTEGRMAKLRALLGGDENLGVTPGLVDSGPTALDRLLGAEDVRQLRDLMPGATIDDYKRVLGILFPGDDLGLAHHKFWDAQDINLITGEGSRTGHQGIAESVRRMQGGARFDSPLGLTPGLADDLMQASTGVSDEVTRNLDARVPLSDLQRERLSAHQDFLNARADQDTAALREMARNAYIRKVPSGEGFDQFWSEMVGRAENLKTISMGIGDAASARAIAGSGRGLVNGFALRDAVGAGEDIPEGLLQAKARALGLTKGQPRYDEALAYGTGKGVTDPKEAVRAYARHFLDIEARSFGSAGAGNPLTDPEALMPLYASLTEGQPTLNQMGGGIHLIFDPETTPYVASLHHPFMMDSPGVLPMHKGTSANFKQEWGPERQAQLAAMLGRDASQVYDEAGNAVSGSPLLTGPAGSTASRVASLIMSDGGTIVKKAASDPAGAAVELLRGGLLKQRGDETSLTRNLAGNASAKRTEALVLNGGPEHVTSVLVKGQNPEVLRDNVAAARELLHAWGIPETPIKVAYGPEGSPGRVYELTGDGPVESWLNSGRKSLVDEVRARGLTDLGVTPQGGQPGGGPGQWLLGNLARGGPPVSRLGVAGSAGVAGAAAGGLAPAENDEERRQHALQGAALGAGLGLGSTTRAGQSILRGVPTGAEFAKNLLGEAWTAQQEAMARPSSGIANWKTMANIWRVQTTSTLRNILQDTGTTTLWLANAKVRNEFFRDNIRSLVQLYNAGKRSGFDALPQDSQDFLTKWGKAGYEPQVGASFNEVNKGIIDKLSAWDTALGEGLLSAADPRQGGVPLLGAGLGVVKGYTRAFQQNIYGTLDSFIKVAGRHAAFQDEADKAMTVAAQDFVTRNNFGGYLDPAKGFDRADVLALAGPKLANEWQALSDRAIKLGEDRAQDIFGNFEKRLPGEQGLGRVVPFVSWALRAYPRTAQMMLDHPGISIALTVLMLDQGEQAKEQGLPGYLAGTVPVSEDTPLVGGVATALNGGRQGLMRANLLGALSPVGGQMFAEPEDLPPDANLYQRGVSALGRTGFSPNPLITALAAATNKDYRQPGALSRTGAVEEALPGPQVPSLLHGAINVARKAAGGNEFHTTGLDRALAGLYFQATGHPIGDPGNMGDPQRAQLLADTTNPDSEIYKAAQRQALISGAAKTATSLTSPVTLSGQTDQQLAAQAARAEVAGRPAAVYDPQQIAQMDKLGIRGAIDAFLMEQANRGTQADLPPELLVNRGASGDARLAALAQGPPSLWSGNSYYQATVGQDILRQLLGLR